MRAMTFIPAAAIGTALILSACGGEAATAQEDSEAATEDADGEEAGAETPAVNDPDGYAEDQTGGMIDAAIVEAVNSRLLSYHAASGNDVRVVLGMSTDGRDVEEVAEEMRGERGANALIFIAGADRALAIVGEGLDESAVSEAENAMVAHFEEDELAEGLNAGVDAVVAQLGE